MFILIYCSREVLFGLILLPLSEGLLLVYELISHIFLPCLQLREGFHLMHGTWDETTNPEFMM